MVLRKALHYSEMGDFNCSSGIDEASLPDMFVILWLSLRNVSLLLNSYCPLHRIRILISVSAKDYFNILQDVR